MPFPPPSSFFLSDTAFRQQRLPAWNPILAPKNVLPGLLLIGLLFAGLGIGFAISSARLFEVELEYTQCVTSAGNDFSDAPAGLMEGDASNYQWKRLTTNGGQSQCIISFTITRDVDISIDGSSPLFLYYKLSNFYQNHRLYVKSVSLGQLQGQAITDQSTLSSQCDPLTGPADQPSKVYFPCGLIANSQFNGNYHLSQKGECQYKRKFIISSFFL